MGIELPPELAAVAAAAGVTWPQADEDAMREAAQAWRDAGTQLSTLTGDADTVARTTLSAVEGETGTAAADHWARFVAPDTGHLTATARGCTSAADRLDHAAEQVGAAKVEIVRNLVALAKNTDAANTAAAAGNPTALLGLDTAVRGTAVNVAAIKDTLVSAVQPGSGQDVSAVRDVVDANPGARLLGGLVDGLGQVGSGLASVAGGVTDGLAQATGGVTDGLAHTAGGKSGGLLTAVGGVTGGLGTVVGGVTGGLAETTGAVTHGLSQATGGLAAATSGLAQTVGGVTGGLTDTVGGLAGAVEGVTGGLTQTVNGVTGGLAETVDGVTHGLAQTASGATDGLANTVGGVTGGLTETVGGVTDSVGDTTGSDVIDFAHANAGTGPISLPMDAPTPPTGFPAIPNDAVQAASAAVLDAPAQQQPAPQPGAPQQPAAPVANAPAAGLPAGGAPPTGSALGGVAGGGLSAGAPAGPAPGGARQQPAPGRESGVATPAPEPRSRPGGGQSAPNQRAESTAEAAPFAPMIGFAPGAQPNQPARSGGPLGATQQPGASAGTAGGQQSQQLRGSTPQPGMGGPPSTQQPGVSGPHSGAVGAPASPHPGTHSNQQPGAQPAHHTGQQFAAPLDSQAVPADAPAHPTAQDGMLALFLVHMFPIGHLPVASSRPARQLPAPPAEVDYAAGLRFPPDDHPQAHLVDLTTRQGTDPGDAQSPPPALTEGYDPLGGEHERDWDRRFLVRDIHPIEYAWPPGELYPEGGSDNSEPEVLGPGAVIDRFGTPEGRVFSADATRFAFRSLPPAHLDAGYHRYRVLRPLPVWRSVSAAWFAQPGGGERYRATRSAADLLALGYLADITQGDDE